jgi:hypothetical protein
MSGDTFFFAREEEFVDDSEWVGCMCMVLDVPLYKLFLPVGCRAVGFRGKKKSQDFNGKRSVKFKKA